MTTAFAQPDVSNRNSEAPRLSGRDIICFSHDWTGDPLSKTHFMRLLARRNRVLWVNSIGYRRPQANVADLGRAWRKLSAACAPLQKVEQNLFVLNPLVVPAHGVKPIRSLNRWWLRSQVKRAMRKLGFERPINWTFNPAAAFVAGGCGEETLVYQCVDEYSAFTGVSPEAILQLEEQLLRRADLVVVSAESLRESKSQLRPDTVLVRHGVDFDHFRRALDENTIVPDDIAHLPKPVIGFFGLIADWVDQELLLAIAARYPHGSLVLLGKVTTDVSRLRLPNIHLLGRRDYSELPAYCKGFDVALNPFLLNRLTLNFNPLKVREYLAAGLAVVSTDLPEVAILDHCHIGKTRADFLDQLDCALRRPGPDATISETMRSESWDSRLVEIEQHLRRTWVQRRSGG
jgi:glycosyltransferase involved in cell wall biosynthesis